MNKIYSLVLLVFISTNLNSQSTFFKTYSGPDHFYDSGWNLLVDGEDFVFSTGSFCNSSNWPCTQIFKVDSVGSIIWHTGIFNTSEPVETHPWNNLIKTSDGGYLLAGAQYFLDSLDNSQAYIWKISPTGNIEWEFSLNQPNIDYTRSVVELPGGGFVVLAEGNPGANLSNATIWKMSLFSISANGELNWYKPFNPSQTLYGPDSHSMMLTKSNELVLCFQHVSFDEPWRQELGLAKFDTLGNEIWTKMFEHKFDNVGQIYERADGNYILFATRDTFIPGSGWPVALSIYCHDTTGQRLWENANYIGANPNEIYDLAILPNGDMAAVGYYYLKSFNAYLPTVFGMDSNGNIKWQRYFDNQYPNNLHGRVHFIDIEYLTDGRLAILGDIIDTVPQINSYEINVMLLVVDSLGCLNGKCDTVLLNAKTTSIVEGIQDHPVEDLIVHPNPSNDNITVALQGFNYSATRQLTITNAIGQSVLSQTMMDGMATINVSKFPPGLLFIQVFEDGKVKAIGKVVVGR